MRRLVATIRLALVTLVTFVTLAVPATPAAAQLGPNLIDPNAWVAECQLEGGRICLRPYGEMDLTSNPLDPIYHPAPPVVASQTIATAPGASYFLRFVGSVTPSFFGSSVFEVHWGGTRVYQTFPPSESTIGPVGLWLTAQDASTTLQFSSALTGVCTHNQCDNWGVTTVVRDLSLRQVVTPEPATLALVGGGALLLAGVSRRRARRSA